MAALLFLALLIALGVLSALGKTADSRDTRYSLGAVLRPRTKTLDSGRNGG